MRAIVFSGGANRGSLQAGAALALLEAGIIPDLVVGSSVGSINGAVLACHPNLAGIQRIAQRWKSVKREDIFPGGSLRSAWRVVRGRGSLHHNHGLRRFILSLLPPNIRRFSDLAIPFFVTATNYRTGDMHLFGDDPRERLVDALMASAAVPPYLPAYHYRGETYLDGGFVSNLPIGVALQQGASEIWALEIGLDAAATVPPFGMRGSLTRTFDALMRRQMAHERELVRLAAKAGVKVHHIQMLHYSGLDVRDFRYSSQLMDLGYQSAKTYLSEQNQLAPVAAPIEPARRSKVEAALRTSIAAQAQLARLRFGILRGMLRRQGLPQDSVIPPS